MKEHGEKYTCDYCDKNVFVGPDKDLIVNKPHMPDRWFLLNQDGKDGKHFCSIPCLIFWLKEKAEARVYGMTNPDQENEKEEN